MAGNLVWLSGSFAAVLPTEAGADGSGELRRELNNPRAQNIDKACALSTTTHARPPTAAQVNTANTVRRRRNERS